MFDELCVGVGLIATLIKVQYSFPGSLSVLNYSQLHNFFLDLL